MLFKSLQEDFKIFLIILFAQSILNNDIYIFAKIYMYVFGSQRNTLKFDLIFIYSNNPQILSFQSIYYLKSIYFLYQMWIDKVILDSAFLYHENIKDALKFFDVYYKFLLNHYYNIFSFHSYYNKMSIVYIHFRLLCVLTNINICQINRLILKNTF